MNMVGEGANMASAAMVRAPWRAPVIDHNTILAPHHLEVERPADLGGATSSGTGYTAPLLRGRLI